MRVKVFLRFQRNCGLRALKSSCSQVLTNCCISGKKAGKPHAVFFVQCVHIAKEATKLPAGEANQKERKMARIRSGPAVKLTVIHSFFGAKIQTVLNLINVE